MTEVLPRYASMLDILHDSVCSQEKTLNNSFPDNIPTNTSLLQKS